MSVRSFSALWRLGKAGPVALGLHLTPLNRLSPCSRALPLYASLLSLGKSGYAALVQRSVAFARLAEQYLRSQPAFDVLTPDPSSNPDDPWHFRVLNVVLFAPSQSAPARFHAEPDSFLRELNESRQCFFTPTVWRGRKAVRMAVSNWMTGLGADALEESKEWRIVRGVFERVVTGG